MAVDHSGNKYLSLNLSMSHAVEDHPAISRKTRAKVLASRAFASLRLNLISHKFHNSINETAGKEGV